MIIDFKKKRFLNSSTYLLDQIKGISILFLLLIVASCFFLDKPTLLFFSKSPESFKEVFKFFGKLFYPLFWILLSQASFFYIRFVLRKEKKSRKFWYVSLALVLSLLVGKIIGLCFGRANPEWFLNHGEAPFRFFEWNCSFHSFPSITSVTIATFATALSCVIPKARSYLLIGGFFLSFIPVISTCSFLSDSLFGFYVGAILSQWIFQKMRREISF